jgi:hypothetical protein
MRTRINRVFFADEVDLRTGRPVWLINQPRIPEHKKLARDIRSEVVVVGGGVFGALIATQAYSAGDASNSDRKPRHWQKTSGGTA